MIIGYYLKCNKKVLIVEKRRSKNQPALEVQRLPNTVDLITASTKSKFTVLLFTFLKHFFKILGKLNNKVPFI